MTTPTHPMQEELAQGNEIKERFKIVTPWVQTARKIVEESVPPGSIKRESWIYYNTHVLEVDWRLQLKGKSCSSESDRIKSLLGVIRGKHRRSDR